MGIGFQKTKSELIQEEMARGLSRTTGKERGKVSSWKKKEVTLRKIILEGCPWTRSTFEGAMESQV